MRVLCFALGVLVFVAIGWQLSIHVGHGFPVLNFFSYFTNIANLLAAATLIASATRSRSAMSPSVNLDQLRFISAVNMLIVGVVFSLLLRNVDLGALLPWINVLLHYVMPVFVVLDFVIDPSPTRLERRHLIRALSVPLLYLVYTLVRGSMISWYPYPFLNPANVGGYGGVAGYALGITLVFLVASIVLMKLGNRQSPQPQIGSR